MGSTGLATISRALAEAKPENAVTAAYGGRADRHPAAVYLARLAPGSRRSVRGSLDIAARVISGGRADAFSFPWHLVEYQHGQALRARLADSYAPATANKHLAAFRGVTREAWRLGLISAEACHRIVDVSPVRGEREPKGRALTAAEISALFSACDDSLAGLRDRAIFAMMLGTGLRRSSVVALDFDDLGAQDVRVVAKGNKELRLPLTQAVAGAVADYLRSRGRMSGPLFVRVSRYGSHALSRLTDQAIYEICRDRAKRAGIRSFSPHDLRRTLATTLLDKGQDLSSVKALLGHANVATTLRYDRRGDAAKRKAAEAMEIPT